MYSCCWHTWCECFALEQTKIKRNIKLLIPTTKQKRQTKLSIGCDWPQHASFFGIIFRLSKRTIRPHSISSYIFVILANVWQIFIYNEFIPKYIIRWQLCINWKCIFGMIKLRNSFLFVCLLCYHPKKWARQQENQQQSNIVKQKQVERKTAD